MNSLVFSAMADELQKIAKTAKQEQPSALHTGATAALAGAGTYGAALGASGVSRALHNVGSPADAGTLGRLINAVGVHRPINATIGAQYPGAGLNAQGEGVLRLPSNVPEGLAAHEIGHLGNLEVGGRPLLQASRAAMRVGKYTAPVAAGYAAASEDPSWAPAVGNAAVWAPRILDETTASLRGAAALGKLHGIKGLGKAMTMVPGQISYGIMAGGPLAITAYRKQQKSSKKKESAYMADELQKTAFGPADATKVLSVAKKLQLPKASSRAIVAPINGNVMAKLPAAMAPQRSNKQALREAMGFINGFANPEHQKASLDALSAVNAPLAAIQKKVDRAIFPGTSSNMVTGSRNLSKITGTPVAPVAPQNKKMMHAIFKGHELDETAVRPSLGMRFQGHNSPEVILREHNKVTTLPPEFSDVRQAVTAMRTHAGDEGRLLAGIHGPGGSSPIQFGTSPRLSRHARKRVTEVLDQQGRVQMQGLVDQANQEYAASLAANTAPAT